MKFVKNYKRFKPSKNAKIAAPLTKREFESTIPGKKIKNEPFSLGIEKSVD